MNIRECHGPSVAGIRRFRKRIDSLVGPQVRTGRLASLAWTRDVTLRLPAVRMIYSVEEYLFLGDCFERDWSRVILFGRRFSWETRT
ncbi:hypothetical protein Naga_100182g6 [Nannochloropsis gaditana]|uniref:Uncharacterized protein n=1 Tax=Nannochloropsis gaditana TaxID=72520 RepID=W7U6Z9_9STRA|nr:hypothetical protein Naga_100182g6 [Nannochloropsis gaditana]